ncbi:MAG: hypothetical protein ACOCZK_00030 [Planctomycetota bacterium]
MRVLCLSVCLVASLAAADRPVRVRVDAAPLNVNGQERVPLGLFGVHAVGLDPELVAELGITTYRTINFVPGGGSRLIGKDGELDPIYAGLDLFIDCQGDRYYEPLPLRNPDYAEACARMGREYGELWRDRLTPATGQRGVVQWWNEPYLNWAERTAGGRGSTIRRRWYDLSTAVAGGPVTIKGWDEPLRYFRWRDRWPVRYEEKRSKDGETHRKRIIGWSVPIPPGVGLGESFTAAETRYWRDPGTQRTWTVERHWYPEDPTMVSFWSGRQNRDFYLMMFTPWARALRAANSEVTILGGWDFNYSAGGWSAWIELYRPLLRACPALIDGLTEHHYGVHPTTVQAWYELGTAEGRAITGRWLRNWNTECQGKLDPAVYGRSSNAVGASVGERAMAEAQYNLADIIGLAARMPAKVGSRTIHNFAGDAFARCGAAWALRLLRPLRGRLVRVAVDDQGCFALAARPEPTRTVLALYNQRAEPMQLKLRAAGARAVSRHWLTRTADGADLRIANEEVAVADGAFAAELPSRQAVVFHIAGAPPSAPAVQRRQYFLQQGGLLRWGGQAPDTLVTTVDLPPGAVDAAQQATLRVVLEGGAAAVTFNDAAESIRVDPDLPVHDITIPRDVLRAGSNRLVFSGDGRHLLVCASLLLEGPATAQEDHDDAP